MSDTAAPAATPAFLAPAKSSPLDEPKKLDDVLLAMDVVDTLRHRERVVDTELDAEARETQLIARLKDIYTAQGIEVPDRILKDGVKALEEKRFVYKPATDGMGVKLARLYVNRSHWLPQSLSVAGGLAALAVGWYVFWAMPQANEWKKLPAEIAQLSAKGQALAIDAAVDQRIIGMQHAGEAFVDAKDRAGAKAQINALKDIDAQLATEYDVRIIYRGDETTGVWRRPPNNPIGRNYYLVVEAVAPGGKVLTLPVVDEETQKTEHVSKWAQRVTEDVWNKAAEEKAQSHIIVNDILGHKARGELNPKYDVATPGGAITKW
ncbi:MAG: DUF6384 family protein [Alphaproteobacteria bacterium]